MFPDVLANRIEIVVEARGMGFTHLPDFFDDGVTHHPFPPPTVHQGVKPGVLANILYDRREVISIIITAPRIPDKRQQRGNPTGQNPGTAHLLKGVRPPGTHLAPPGEHHGCPILETTAPALRGPRTAPGCEGRPGRRRAAPEAGRLAG